MLSLLFGVWVFEWAINLPVGKELFDFTITPWKTEQKKLKKVKLLKKVGMIPIQEAWQNNSYHMH